MLGIYPYSIYWDLSLLGPLADAKTAKCGLLLWKYYGRLQHQNCVQSATKKEKGLKKLLWVGESDLI